MWDNYEDLEEKLSLDELMATLEAAREREHRQNKFMAALKGVDLDAESKEQQMTRVAAEMERIEKEMGLDESVTEKKDDFSVFGIAVMEGG